jgi:hypothetical protein
MFKPNLIPNEPKDGSFKQADRDHIINVRGGVASYIVTQKKDGCRMEFGAGDTILTRALKPVKSKLVRQRFEKFQKTCLDLNIIVEGEFYAHSMKFNEIFRFFAKEDVTDPKSIKELTNMKSKKPKAFQEKYGGRDIEFLTKFHDELRLWIFDGIVLDMPELIGYQERMDEIKNRLAEYADPSILFTPELEVRSLDELYTEYDNSITEGFEGLVLTHKFHPYKNGRTTLKTGTLLKLKDDKKEFDGIVIDVEESTVAREGAEKKINELGRSVTSKLKADRIPSGMAKGFVVEYEGKGTFCVGLNGFDHDARRELLANKANYIGKHFRYTGMPPVKDFPRHAYFDCWRDEK